MMNSFQVSTVIKVLLVVWAVLTTLALLSTEKPSAQSSTNVTESYEMPSLQIENGVKVDNSEVLGVFEHLLPSKKIEKSSASKAAATAPKKVVDKTLLPNYQRFDDKHQVGLTAIFDAGTQFAVVALLNYETRQTDYKRLVIGDVLGNFTLTGLTNNQAQFTGDNEQLVLSIFTQQQK